MGPSAMSTVMEQVVRIVFILAGGYLILNVLNGTIKAAVGIATFAAFIGDWPPLSFFYGFSGKDAA
ncbi:hypothetical protein ACPJHQ_20565 [Rossellomorea sp. H39__3]